MNERDLGLELFFTGDLPGIGGKLRRTPEDFVVDEVSVLPPPSADGKFVIAQVWHKNWEMNRLVRRLSSNLKIGRSRVGFAGTKDGRSVATQLMSFNAPIESVKALTIPDVKIIEAYTARRMIEIGDLVGNSFRIVVRGITPPVEVERSCEAIKTRLDELGGFPNFFGVQRFGSIRPITHLIGKDLIRGDFEGAVMRYIANPMAEEDSDANQARHTLQESKDFKRALAEFPKKLAFERTMINYLVDKPGDYLGALRTLPKNLLMMFVHAYQSYLFNRVLSERIRVGLPINEPLVGDLVLPLNKLNLPDHDHPIPVTAENLDKAVKNSREGKAFVAGVLYGTDSTIAGGPMGEIERRIIDGEGISKKDFQIVGLREASSKGTRREILATYRDLRMEFAEESVGFSFTLNKGCYATALLREFMKTDMGNY